MNRQAVAKETWLSRLFDAGDSNGSAHAIQGNENALLFAVPDYELRQRAMIHRDLIAPGGQPGDVDRRLVGAACAILQRERNATERAVKRDRLTLGEAIALE